MSASPVFSFILYLAPFRKVKAAFLKEEKIFKFFILLFSVLIFSILFIYSLLITTPFFLTDMDNGVNGDGLPDPPNEAEEEAPVVPVEIAPLLQRLLSHLEKQDSKFPRYLL